MQLQKLQETPLYTPLLLRTGQEQHADQVLSGREEKKRVTIETVMNAANERDYQSEKQRVCQ